MDEFCSAGPTRFLELMFWAFTASQSHENYTIKFLPFWIVDEDSERPNYGAADHIYKSFAVEFVKALYSVNAPEATLELMLKIRDNFVCFPHRS